jgi:hypothetical protein
MSNRKAFGMLKDIFTIKFVYLFTLKIKVMAALIIESKNPANLKILAAMARHLGDNVRAVDVEEIEDLLFGKMMEKEKTGQKVTKDTIMKTLGVK